MSSDEQSSGDESRERTIKTAGRIVKYSREIYHLESVEEVANLTLEATPHFIDGHPSPTVVEVRNEGLRVLASMMQGVSGGEEPGNLAQHAYDTGTVVVRAGPETDVNYTSDDIEVVDGDDSGVTIAAPTVYNDGVAETGAVLVVHWHSLAAVEEYHVKPVDYFAEHIATAITNIRSRERLERARNDLAKRKEMVEVYDKLLRHDLGNDLQVIRGFSDQVARMVEDDDTTNYAQKIQSTATSASELIDNVGETVKTLQEEGEPEARDLEPILTEVVEDVETKFESLTVDYDPADFDYRVYSGDLIDSVFTNIMSNAAVHNDQDIHLKVYSEEPSPDRVRIGISDDGKGVAEEVRDEIFEMGQKGPESEGTGFGLGLARTLVESYGGDVELRDSDRGGADFRITLERA